MTVRTRFAPSPTGYLHIGGARTALYAWLYARKHQGTFVLRIEDTDQERSTPEAVQAILDGMAWLGLDYDEGPYYQMQRMARYQEVLEQLLVNNQAYRCYCSKERLDKLREEQIQNKQKPKYDGHCRDLNRTDDAPFVVRFRTPSEGAVAFNDLVRGPIEVQNNELDDLIIARTDGTPTYNFTVVVDDWDMKITHVIRGDDHINNTPRQINILKALNADLPKYAHIPMILGEDGKRLSKRHGAVSVLQYRDDGYLSHALLNYLVRLGWSFGDQEIFSIDEMIEKFSLANVSKSAATFNPEKLLWLNQHYLKHDDPEKLSAQLAWQLEQLDITPSSTPALKDIVSAQAERCKTLKEMAEKSRFFFEDVNEYDEKAAKKNLTQDAIPIFEALLNAFNQMDGWQKEAIHEVITETAIAMDVGMGKVAQPVRVAVTGGTVSPSIDLTLTLLGKEKVIERITKAMAFIRK